MDDVSRAVRPFADEAAHQVVKPEAGGVLVDYHTHPPRVPPGLSPGEHGAHFRTAMGDYAARAADLGLAELGFSEHIYRLSIAPGAVPWENPAAPRGDIGAYVDAALAVREAQAHMRAAGQVAPAIRLGMEVDVVPSTVSLVDAALPLYPFDYILGAVHQVPDLAAGATAEQAYRAYYRAIQWAAASGLFHSIAHPDRVHRKTAAIPLPLLEGLMAETAAVLARCGVSVEMSANGVRGGHTGLDPHTSFVRLCREHGAAITLGSDAHTLETLGAGLPAVRDLLWEVGYREVATYDRGRRIDRPLAPPRAQPDGRATNRQE